MTALHADSLLPPPPGSFPQPGDTIDAPYLVVEVIGVGGMGAVVTPDGLPQPASVPAPVTDGVHVGPAARDAPAGPLGPPQARARRINAVLALLGVASVVVLIPALGAPRGDDDLQNASALPAPIDETEARTIESAATAEPVPPAPDPPDPNPGEVAPGIEAPAASAAQPVDQKRSWKTVGHHRTAPEPVRRPRTVRKLAGGTRNPGSTTTPRGNATSPRPRPSTAPPSGGSGN